MSRFSKAFLIIFAFFIVEGISYDYHYQRDTSIECFVSYLKEQNECDIYLNSVRVYSQISQECRAGVAFEMENLLAQAQLTLQFRSNFGCLKDEVQGNKRFENLLLNLRAVKMTSDGVRWIGSLWSRNSFPKDLAVARIDSAIASIISTAEFKCELKLEFGNLFDSFFEKDQEGTSFVSYEPVQEFCVRKELEEKAFFNRNPTTWNQDNFQGQNCTEIMEYIRNGMIDRLNDLDSANSDFLRKHCALTVLRESDDYFHQILKAEFIIKSHFSLNQSQNEREIFIDKLTKVALKVRENCS